MSFLSFSMQLTEKSVQCMLISSPFSLKLLTKT